MRIASNFRTGRRFSRVAGAALSLLLAVVGQAQSSTPAGKPAASALESKSGKVVLYAAVGPKLTQYDVDVESAVLTERGSVDLPGNVQYAWPHPSGKYFYVAWTNGSGAIPHGVTAFRIDGRSGALTLYGEALSLRFRPVHITLDIPGTHLLVAYNNPSGVSVHQIGTDGRIGAEVKQPAALDTGIYAHQIRVAPSNKMVILVTRGNAPARGKAEDPGALKVMSYRDGLLTSRASVAPGGGFGFQPRHLDFSGPWIFVSLERQNKLQVYRKLSDEAISSAPLFTRDSLSDPSHVRPLQDASTVHVHPNGRFVYQGNRAGSTSDFQGKRVFAGGENAIAVYSINQETGEPALVQNADTHGSTPRTFALDPSGRILVAGNENSMLVREGQGVRVVPAGLAVYRVRQDGKLDFVRKYDVETDGPRDLFWMGIVSLP